MSIYCDLAISKVYGFEFLIVMQTFVVDSNFFIQAHRVYYPLDIATSFWERIAILAGEGTIVSVDKVRNELYENDDDLKIWCNTELPLDFFKDTEELLDEYKQVIQWASTQQQYLSAAVHEFLDADKADAWLVAYGLKNNCPIITYEKSEPNIRRKIKIPEPCNALNVQYMNTIELFRTLGVRF